MSIGIIDATIDKCLEARKLKAGTLVPFDLDEVYSLCDLGRVALLKDAAFINVKVPVQIVGDIHGQFHDLMRIFEICNFPPIGQYLFLGDYVDRGLQSLEVFMLLLAYRLKFPRLVQLLRGNHETASISRQYGFYDECKRRCNIKVWRRFVDIFDCLPLAALVEGSVLCMHGGLSPDLKTLADFNSIKMPCDVPTSGMICDLLWADPHRGGRGWGTNDRGVSVTFGPDILRQFLVANELDLLVRAHQVAQDGYEFFAGRRCVTIFSAPNYCGEFDNSAAILMMDAEFECKFQVLKPSKGARCYSDGESDEVEEE